MTTITVNTNHIGRGRAQHNLLNPIALAFEHIDRFAVVTNTHVHILSGIYELPRHAAEWLDRYNNGKDVYPMSFVLP